MNTITVKLTYFKRNGKYYCDGEYEALVGFSLLNIWDQVERRRESGNLPGLAHGAGREFIILVQAPDHPNAHPKLITS